MHFDQLKRREFITRGSMGSRDARSSPRWQ
jgi:hypothetical protein